MPCWRYSKSTWTLSFRTCCREAVLVEELDQMISSGSIQPPWFYLFLFFFLPFLWFSSLFYFWVLYGWDQAEGVWWRPWIGPFWVGRLSLAILINISQQISLLSCDLVASGALICVDSWARNKEYVENRKCLSPMLNMN